MESVDPDAFAKQVAAESDTEDATGWFERLYTAAENGETAVPWDRGTPHPLLENWLERRYADREPGTALIVGCGPGWDAERIAKLGYDTTAFDVSPTAVEGARRQHHATPVRYEVADLFSLPVSWNAAFDLVVESLTVQSMPVRVRAAAADAVAATVAPGGTLLVIATARDEGEATNGPPWPLTRSDIDLFAAGSLKLVDVERIPFPDASSGQWRAQFVRHRE